MQDTNNTRTTKLIVASTREISFQKFSTIDIEVVHEDMHPVELFNKALELEGDYYLCLDNHYKCNAIIPAIATLKNYPEIHGVYSDVESIIQYKTYPAWDFRLADVINTPMFLKKTIHRFDKKFGNLYYYGFLRTFAQYNLIAHLATPLFENDNPYGITKEEIAQCQKQLEM